MNGESAHPSVSIRSTLEQRLCGLLIGTAVGDALGLPAEGLSPLQIQRRWSHDWRMRLLCRRGMFSDDTEHTIMVCQSLLTSSHDPEAFQKRFASQLRWWFAALPAGVGMATARACLKLWIGIAPNRSGVRSAGNGPAMRVAILGACFATNDSRRREFVSAAVRITHTDDRAEIAARAVAEAAAWAINEKPFSEFLPHLRQLSDNEEWIALCRQLKGSMDCGLSVRAFARRLGLNKGVSGYAFHTVPVALYACARHEGDFRSALTEALSCGGDTDTLGAIVGALAGTSVGRGGIPGEWVNGIMEWPRSLRFLEALAERLARQTAEERPIGPLPYFWLGILPRNLFFLVVVLCHGFRRLFPPYR